MGDVTAELSPTDRARIDQRYPRRSPIDVTIAALATVALLAAITLVVISGIERANPEVAAMVRSFDVKDPTLTVVDIVVQRRDPDQAAQCFLFAQAVSFERVGELTVEIPPGTEVLTSMDVPIQTVKEATSVTLENCHIVE